MTFIPFTPGAHSRALLELAMCDQTARDVAIIAWPDRANAYFFMETLGITEVGLCGVRPHSGDPIPFADEIDFLTAINFGALI